MPKKSSGPLRQGIGPCKANLLRTMNNLKVLAKQPVPTELDALEELLDRIQETTAIAQTQIATLISKEQKWTELIAEITDDADITAEETLFTTTAYAQDGFMILVEETKATVSLLEARAKKIQKLISEQPVAGASGTTPERKQGERKVHLPKLTLPTFDGDFTRWQEFWSLFKANIHDSELTDGEKFSYLKAQLKGSASESIDGIAICDENYGIAVSTLQSRFQKPPETLICAYYSQLKRLPKASQKVADMQKTFDSCERIFRQLENAGEDVDSNRSLVLDVLNKFPDTIIKNLFWRGKVSPSSPLSQLREAIKDQIQTSEHLEGIFENLEPFSPSSPRKNPVKEHGSSMVKSSASDDATKHPSSALTARDSKKEYQEKGKFDASKSDVKSFSPCYFCNGDHRNSDCPDYASSEERAQRLKKLGRCGRCMSERHSQESDCTLPASRMVCYNCRAVGQHMSSLCPQKYGKPNKGTTLSATVSTVKPNSAMLNLNEQSLLMTAVATVRNPETGVQKKVRLLLDTGSHRSYLTDQCADDLGLVAIQRETVEVTIFGTERTLSVASRRVQLEVQLRDGQHHPIHANTTALITGGSVIPDSFPSDTVKLIDSMRYALADDYRQCSGQVDILIGSDHFWEFLNGTRMTVTEGLYVIPSTLGLLLAGRYWDGTESAPKTALLCLTEAVGRRAASSLGMIASESRLSTDYPDIDEFWRLETVGISDNPCEDDEKALEQFNATVQFQEGRYYVKWPWRNTSEDCLPTNYQLALGRFKSLAKRLDQDPDLRVKYQKVIDDQCQKGIIEKVEPMSKAPVDHLMHYLPHHAVVKLSSTTTKVRIVYDASAKTRKDAKSLNECLYRGPVILPDLCGTLLRFRLWPIALVADLEKGFSCKSVCRNPTVMSPDFCGSKTPRGMRLTEM